jgi:transcription antitermination factor NusG
METSEAHWYILYAPMGFGKPRHLYQLEAALRRIGIQFAYPCIEIEIAKNGTKTLKPLFADYAFIKCKWEPSLESVITEASMKPVKILKKEVVLQDKKSNSKNSSRNIHYEPVPVSEEELQRIQEIAVRLEDDIPLQHELLEALKAEDLVRFVKGVYKGFTGRVIRSITINKVLVEMSMLGRQVQIPTDVSSIERV